MSDTLPPVRTDLQFTSVDMDGREMVAVRDMSGLSEQVGLLSPEALALLPFFDGMHTVSDLCSALTRASGGHQVEPEDVAQIVEQFEHIGLLQTEEHLARAQEHRAAWVARDLRQASLAGQAYPDQKDALTGQLDDILALDPGALDSELAPRVVIAPHIDLAIGRQGYGAAYGPLTELKPERVIVLGTGHNLPDGLFSLTDKSFETPLGISRADARAVKRLREAGFETVAEDDFAHLAEHSIEFQVLFIQHLFGTGVSLVPILCGSFHELLLPQDGLADIPAAKAFCDELGRLANMEGSLTICGVDLSHSGPKFGHRKDAPSLQPEFEAHDRALLDALLQGDHKALWNESRRIADHYNVCGFSSLATVLTACPDLTGSLGHYEIWHEEATRSAVSFAAAHLS